MGKVIRVVRIPVWDETMSFELALPRGAEIFKVDAVFTGAVNREGRPIEFDAVFLLADAQVREVETRRFQVGYLASGIDDLTSETAVLPGSAYRFISTIQGARMLFEVLDAHSEIEQTDRT